MKTENIHYFNLGMAPLANVGQSRKSFIQERIAALIYEFGSEIYPSKDYANTRKIC